MSRYTRLPRKGAAEPSPRRRWKAALAIIFAVVIVFAAAVVGALLLLRGDGGPSSPKAAIVDQLSLNEPNPEFVQSVTGTLQGAGYTVDYFSGEYATVDLFRILPERGYDLLILRVHSARVKESREGALTEEVALFTARPTTRASTSRSSGRTASTWPAITTPRARRRSSSASGPTSSATA